MKRSEIAATLNKANIRTELSPLGVIIEGRILRHNDATGLTTHNASKFRARDVWDLLQYLSDEGFEVNLDKLHRARKAEKIS